MEHRTGIGYDLHRLTSGRKLFLGWVEIPYIHGLLGHSDADVLLHAICDALLGAIGQGDIGELFPDTDPRYDGISSRELLKIVYELVAKKNFSIVNVDTVVVAEEPKLFPFKKQMRQAIAGILNIKEDSVNIKAKTNEGIGEVGDKLAIAAYAIVTVVSGEDK
ncbi:MAG: 2-C-methyl-D-erythritol 2,4-cyclodiphosphate synthase [Candidatus Omnitrophica bacterium]|nr:2-C-methyl-D-erythritol 2,4-cyclodiphosphate synthase [Candidatus Omnitrophota bacterium]